jgi:hypothetical protein
MATKHVVTGDQYRDVDRRMGEIKRQLNQKGGSPLDPSGVLAMLQHIIEGGSTMVDCDATPFIPERWEIRPEDQLPGRVQGQVDATKLGLYLPVKQKDYDLIAGHKLRRKLEGKPVLPANVLDYLYENQHLIPEEWKGKTVFFWGTVYRDWYGLLCVRGIWWNPAGCYWRACRLGSDWWGSPPAAISAS